MSYLKTSVKRGGILKIPKRGGNLTKGLLNDKNNKGGVMAEGRKALRRGGLGPPLELCLSQVRLAVTDKVQDVDQFIIHYSRV